MRIERVAVNASPLIALFQSGQSELLPQLFDDIIVPESVWREVAETKHDDVAATGLRSATWAKKTSVSISPRIEPWNLGAGESAVLSVALVETDCRALVDDRAARRCAKTIGVRTLGTGGLLVLAKRRGLVTSVAGAIRKLSDAGLWLSDDLIALLLRQAGE